MDALHARQSKLKRKLEALEADIKRQKDAEKQQQTAQLQLQVNEFVAPLVQKLAPLSDLFFTCVICHEEYPRHVPDSTLPSWWQNWMIEFPCGHPLCRACFTATLSATELSWDLGNVFVTNTCPFCLKPNYVSPIRTVDLKRDEVKYVPRDSAMCVVTQPEDDSDDEDSMSSMMDD